MSNYPLGVTGAEPAIAGPIGEIECEVECIGGQEDFTAFLTTRGHVAAAQGVLATLEDVYRAEDPYTAYSAASGALRVLLRSLQEVQLPHCPFIGTVTVSLWPSGEVTWTCPVCSHDHEIYLGDDD